ncbi:MAG: TonB-dependent receptor [Bacteroidota bacterium]
MIDGDSMLIRRVGSWIVMMCMCLVSYTQKTLIVRDIEDNESVDSVYVVLQLGEGTTRNLGYTNIEGVISIELEESESILGFSHPDYAQHQLPWEEISADTQIVYLSSLSYEMENVVFTASKFKSHKNKVGQQVFVIQEEEIQLSNPQNSADLLANSGGVFIQKSQLGGGSPNLRGFEANKVLLVVDGVRMNNAIYRSGHLQNVLSIDPEMISRSEVLFGPGSVMYGSDALGGVIHFYTKKPTISPDGRTKVRVGNTFRLGSASQEKYLHSEVEIGKKNWASITSFSFHDFGDLRVGSNRSKAFEEVGRRNFYVSRENGSDIIVENPDPDLQMQTGYQQYDFLQKFLWVPSNFTSHTLNLQYSTTNDVPRFDRLTTLVDGLPRYAEWSYGPQLRMLGSYHLYHTKSQKIWDEVKLVASFQRIQESRNSRLFQSDLLNKRIEDVYVGSLNLDILKKWRGGTLLYGAEASFNQVNSAATQKNITSFEQSPLDTRYPDGGSFLKNLALYSTWQKDLSKKHSVKSGLRWTAVSLLSRFEDTTFFQFPFDEIHQKNLAFSGSFEWIFHVNKKLDLIYTSGTGFRAPNLDDVAKVFDSQPGNVIFPNPNLRPEFTYNSDYSIRLKPNKNLQLEITHFQTLYDDAIVVRNQGYDSVIYEGVLSQVQTNVNAQNAYLIGFNGGIRWSIIDWTLGGNLNWTYGNVIEDDDSVSPLNHIPPLYGKAFVNWKKSRFDLRLESLFQGWKRLDRFSQRDFNNIEFATAEGWPAWIVFNVKSHVQLSKKVAIDLGVENIFDTHYRTFSSRISAPGRNVYASLRLNF